MAVGPWRLVSAERTLVLPGNVRYELDLGKLEDEAEKKEQEKQQPPKAYRELFQLIKPLIIEE